MAKPVSDPEPVDWRLLLTPEHSKTFLKPSDNFFKMWYAQVENAPELIMSLYNCEPGAAAAIKRSSWDWYNSFGKFTFIFCLVEVDMPQSEAPPIAALLSQIDEKLRQMLENLERVQSDVRVLKNEEWIEVADSTDELRRAQ